jgi:hypothetical protein
LGDLSVKTVPNYTNDIWNHVVTVPTEVWEDGVLLTNWSPVYIQAADASGNRSYFQRHRSLDPRYVWRLDMDFEPVSEFAIESLATVRLPDGPSTISTNVLNVPVTISWNGTWIDASIPTNQPGIALKFVGAADDAGERLHPGGGSWNQYMFRQGDFMGRRGNFVVQGRKPTKVTLAIVPNVHATYYIQPRLVTDYDKLAFHSVARTPTPEPLALPSF